jgi:hypothetical protein
MESTDEQKPLAQIKADVGARLREVRQTVLNVSQQQLGETIPQMSKFKNKQGQIRLLEKGQGSADGIWAMLHYLHASGIDLNYLFGEVPPRRRDSSQVVFTANVSTYVEAQLRRVGHAMEMLEEAQLSTETIIDHLSSLGVAIQTKG